eukprot:gnl/TRDRNA2_/TRDRNA2_202302_c0_seq1.p1 gnl/TRDRNA2_/TRDRNA2_202302_c0~~gnl/TRDRNA2_/TRDRNA2_202302_c0_seq1.p1  ORF type:complete len:152 (+),score=26.91 gnl/TRDRNA2_/TRDRNA2_202302_c0_seq1:52-507(+)
MPCIEDKYYQLPSHSFNRQHVTTGRMLKVCVALIATSCLVLVFILATSVAVGTPKVTSAARLTSLVGLRHSLSFQQTGAAASIWMKLVSMAPSVVAPGVQSPAARIRGDMPPQHAAMPLRKRLDVLSRAESLDVMPLQKVPITLWQNQAAS